MLYIVEVTTIYNDVESSFVPLSPGVMVGLKKNNQWYRVIDSTRNANTNEWDLVLRDETVVGDAQLRVPAEDCIPTFGYDWTKYFDEWLPKNEDLTIPQCDGTFNWNGKNAGVQVSKWMKHFDANEAMIREEYDYVNESGIDEYGLPRNHSRFDANGFATKANNNLM